VRRHDDDDFMLMQQAKGLERTRRAFGMRAFPRILARRQPAAAARERDDASDGA
jgi:hypothetical protein